MVRGRVGKLPAARPAKNLSAGDISLAVRATPGEPRAAVLAKPCPPGVRGLARGTPHGGSPEVSEKLACFWSLGHWHRPGWGRVWGKRAPHCGLPEWPAVRSTTRWRWAALGREAPMIVDGVALLVLYSAVRLFLVSLMLIVLIRAVQSPSVDQTQACADLLRPHCARHIRNGSDRRNADRDAPARRGRGRACRCR